MDLFKMFLTTSLSIIAARAVASLFFKNPSVEKMLKLVNAERVILRKNIALIIASVMSLGLSISMIILYKFDLVLESSVNSLTIFILWILPAVSGLYFLISSLSFKIEFFKDKDYFTYKDLFIKKRKIYYSEIEELVELLNGDLLFYVNGKKYRISNVTSNFNFIRTALRRNVRYRTVEKHKKPLKKRIEDVLKK